MQNIIIDADPGIDDALALLLAVTSSEDINIIGVTTVAGNKPAAVTTANALKILALANASRISVYRGCQHPLMTRTLPEHNYYGDDGLGDIGLIQQSNEPQISHAVDFMIDAVMSASAKSITLCAIAPLTNVALACVKEPRFAARLTAIYIMGGDAVNQTPEFNFSCDPQAAAIVLRCGANIKLFGFDVTSQVKITHRLYEALAGCESHSLNSVRMMLDFCKNKDAALHDVCTIAAIIEPSLFEFDVASVDVKWRDIENGGSCFTQKWGARSGVRIAIRVDVCALSGLIIERISRLSGTN